MTHLGEKADTICINYTKLSSNKAYQIDVAMNQDERERKELLLYCTNNTVQGFCFDGGYEPEKITVYDYLM